MSIFVRAWSAIPILIRAVAGGLLVQVVGFVILVSILPLNLRLLPEVPWALLPLGVALWVYWSYFGGRGWPRGTAGLRRRLRRSHPVPRGPRVTLVVAAGLFSTTVILVAILQYALRELPPEALGLVTGLAGLPLWSSVPLALGTALFVGVGEELSFRGYMQVPIEDRHGPWLGLTVPALVFAAAHGTDLLILPVFFVVSIGWSYLAWSVDSIRPGIAFHALVDSVGFLWAIFRIEDLQRILEYSLIDQGLTPGYAVLLLVTLILTVGTLVAFFALHRAVRREGSDGKVSRLP